ncbi:MAG TPA: hypothetical protein VES66_09250 [Terriglobales bacterium]|nr:hypothetical protein [Terriglobales bacterium]
MVGDVGKMHTWNEEINGPEQLYSEMGSPRAMTQYTTQLNVGGQKRLVTVFVPQTVFMALQRRTSHVEEAIKNCVRDYLRAKVDAGSIPQDREHYKLDEDEAVRLFDNRLR